MRTTFYLPSPLQEIIYWLQLIKFMLKDSQRDQNSLRLFKKYNLKIEKKKTKKDLPRPNKGPEIDCQIWVARHSFLVQQFAQNRYYLQFESKHPINPYYLFLGILRDTLLYFIRLYKLLTIYNSIFFEFLFELDMERTFELVLNSLKANRCGVR